MTPEKQQRPGADPEAPQVVAAATAILPDAAPDGMEETARCLSCSRRITAAESIAHGFGPVCRTRLATRQRHERHAALDARLRGLLRRLPSLDVAVLSVVSDALDAAVDALDAVGVAL